MYGIHEAAKRVGVVWYRLRWADMTGIVKCNRLLGRRVFTDDDVKKLRHHFIGKGKLTA